ncbi:MAG TPA: hypothetical protein VM598_07820 [Bdellovibrionota bacterium]|nr:hypothetical protein [Bdellovibrionota bacterium]
MKLLFLAAIGLFASVAHAGYTPVTGSCVADGTDWVRCQVKSDFDGSISTMVLPRHVVKCYQMRGYENDRNCLYPPHRGYCIFKNPYAGVPYRTEVETAIDVASIQVACENVLACINGPLCVRADAPQPRFGWVLESAVTYAH